MAATFYSQILGMFDWEAISADIDTAIKGASESINLGFPDVVVEVGHASAAKDPDDGEYVTGSAYLGTTFSIMPSGKYWTFWACSNTTAEERDRDTRFMEALERVADKFELFVHSGDGDPCDMFVSKSEELS